VEEIEKLSSKFFFLTFSKHIHCFETGGYDKGIDVWNPSDGAIKTIVDVMPIEIGRTSPHQLAEMISTNNFTELVFFGGFGDAFFTDVWKYKYLSNSWELLGNINVGRKNHLAIPVTGIECP
jgi:hypothetical protein